ncbi:MAG: aldolase [Magnetovibrio sp.]|jgi:hypothetical protein|nr:aldolase [Magnetovibrio sp.]
MEDAFEERQKSEEAKYKLDQEQRFKARSRRNKLLGLWAAKRMGLAGPEAEAYAMEVVQAELQKPGDGDVAGKLVGDFRGRGVAIGEAEIAAEMERLHAVALEQIAGEYPEALDKDHETVIGG